jgi:ATP-dependent exoDNAse (exonuclease V) beta subunit
MSVTEWLAGSLESEPPLPGDAQDVTAGSLVHRLFQAARVAEALDDEELRMYTRDLLRAEERVSVQDVGRTIGAAITAWNAIRRRPDVAELLASGQCLYEVPFSMRREQDGGSQVLRGTIDCLVQRNDGSIAVLEFKTGKRRSSHEQQLALYVGAARILFPQAAIEGHLIYPVP